ncbi:MAG: PQQ-dependent sugar dehydrogenase [Roseiarcus sp.]|jgi:glucose/arabinose dehydrogenase|uniref:PQQ-dependent sugar dehydrogenase n=1 Tax=Roseiarcus sp. TaxID=1969460 RepID=UPI003C1537DE
MRLPLLLASILIAGSSLLALADDSATRIGAAAYGDWRSDAPGVRRKLTAADLPAPGASRSVANPSRVVARPESALPKAPEGFVVSLFASGLNQPRVVRVAPNGDVFVAESAAGRVAALSAADGAAKAASAATFAAGLHRPFGIAFYPPGPDPRYVYVAETDRVVRFPYRNGDTQAAGPAEVVVPSLPAGRGHWTRDLAFSADGKTMFVSVGSASNIAEEMPEAPAEGLAAFVAKHAPGAAWGAQENRADVLAFDPDGGGMRVFATGLRNCSGLTVQPQSGALWCAVNERDALGDDLPPDYVTSVKPGAFYGWPWFYIGDHEDPRLAGLRGDLAKSVTTPDVLIQAHSAPLGITFYEGAQFPAAYRGDAFVALHGSWNRAKRTGYKVVRLPFEDGAPTGEYEDFLVGFVADDASVWGRPVDVAVAHDGALLVTDDAGGAIWRVAYQGR